MSFLQPLPSCGGGDVVISCCPDIFTGYCLNDGTPIAITIVNGVQTTWTNLMTGVVTPGPPPAGTGICPSGIDTVTVLQGTSPWVVSGSVELGAATLAALDTVTVLQGTTPWSIDVANASTASAPLQTVTGAAAVVLASNPTRRSFTIQNTGLVTVYIAFGATNPTATNYHFSLSSGTLANDGKGSFYVDDQWSGDVRAFSTVAGSIVIMEIT